MASHLFCGRVNLNILREAARKDLREFLDKCSGSKVKLFGLINMQSSLLHGHSSAVTLSSFIQIYFPCKNVNCTLCYCCIEQGLLLQILFSDTVNGHVTCRHPLIHVLLLLLFFYKAIVWDEYLTGPFGLIAQYSLLKVRNCTQIVPKNTHIL